MAVSDEPEKEGMGDVATLEALRLTWLAVKGGKEQREYYMVIQVLEKLQPTLSNSRTAPDRVPRRVTGLR